MSLSFNEQIKAERPKNNNKMSTKEKKKAKKIVSKAPKYIRNEAPTVIKKGNQTAVIRGGLVTVTTREELTPETIQHWYKMMAFMTALTEEMDHLRDTSYFNARIGKAIDTLANEMELYEATKAARVWKTDNGMTAEMVYQGSEIIRSVVDCAFRLADQPPEVQQRYQDEFTQMTIKYGIADPEVFNSK